MRELAAVCPELRQGHLSDNVRRVGHVPDRRLVARRRGRVAGIGSLGIAVVPARGEHRHSHRDREGGGDRVP